MVMFLQPDKISSADLMFVKELLLMDKKERDFKDEMLGEICPESLFAATRIAVIDLHEYRVSGNVPVRLLFRTSNFWSRTSLEKSNLDRFPSRLLNLRISSTRLVQFINDGGMVPLMLLP